MEKIKIQTTSPKWGIQLGEKTINVHDRAQCEGEYCCIHNPSDHPLKDAPMNWRADKGQMERLCLNCGCGHPDPDDTAYSERIDPGSSSWRSVHGCCGACSGECRY